MVEELIAQYPIISIIIIGVVVTLISTLVTKWLTNQEHLRSLKERQKQLQKDMKGLKPEDKKFMELQSEILQITGTMFKSSFKPILITAVPFLLLFYWIKEVYTPLMGFTWFWYYLGASILASLVYRKLFNMA